MASGLKILGFHDLMKKHSSVLEEELFARTTNITTEKVISALKFMSEPDSQPPTVQTYLLVFLNKPTNNQLEMFLQFATGAPMLLNFGIGKISIKFAEEISIFASTCLNTVTFPQTFPDQETFNGVMLSVMESEKPFNCL